MVEMENRMMRQNAEFVAMQGLYDAWQRLRMVAVVDDDYPTVRSDYETALGAFLTATEVNRKNRVLPIGPSEMFADVMTKIVTEVNKARAKHPTMPTHHHAASVLREEYEEYWEHVKADTYFSDDAEKELVQIAASAIRAICDVPR